FTTSPSFFAVIEYKLNIFRFGLSKSNLISLSLILFAVVGMLKSCPNLVILISFCSFMMKSMFYDKGTKLMVLQRHWSLKGNMVIFGEVLNNSIYARTAEYRI